MAKYDIQKMLVTSTGHITKETHDILTDADGQGLAPNWAPDMERDEGWLWFVQAEEHEDPGTPKELKKLFAIAREQGCDVLYLDCDGYEIEGLGTYNW